MCTLFKVCSGSNLIRNLLQPRVDIIVLPSRNRNILGKNIPIKRFNPWLTKQHRKQHEEYLTPDNKEFINQVVRNKYPQPSAFGTPSYVSPLKNEPIEPTTQVEWHPKLKRTGVIAKKIGVVPLWLKNGKKVLTTLLQVIDNHVIKYIPPEEFNTVVTRKKAHVSSKYGCLVVGADSTHPAKFTKEYCGLFEESGVMPKKVLTRFNVSPEAKLQPGTPLFVNHFQVGEHIDIRGNTIDRGFQGVMKRWGFHGMPASHGVTKTHRRPGNIGSGGKKARVMPGTKLPGHMGNRTRIIRGIRILRINTTYNVLYVHCQGIPGETNSYVFLYDTLLKDKRKLHPRSFPTANADENLPEDILVDDLHNFRDNTIVYKDDK